MLDCINYSGIFYLDLRSEIAELRQRLFKLQQNLKTKEHAMTQLKDKERANKASWSQLNEQLRHELQQTRKGVIFLSSEHWFYSCTPQLFV